MSTGWFPPGQSDEDRSRQVFVAVTGPHRRPDYGQTAEARTKLHDLVESLPSEDVPTALRVLEALTFSSDPVPLALRAYPLLD